VPVSRPHCVKRGKESSVFKLSRSPEKGALAALGGRGNRGGWAKHFFLQRMNRKLGIRKGTGYRIRGERKLLAASQKLLAKKKTLDQDKPRSITFYAE